MTLCTYKSMSVLHQFITFYFDYLEHIGHIHQFITPINTIVDSGK